ncbi:MAG: hypothetical protein Q8830_03055, partial [Candidatus Phytoplasma australasiaticum]|nr:hypothetical protein [Candidatus Phytoplasma australasiaticum]MDV3181179.1 hypothetical protein [Candidatus Phytoplasma australasiaticum]MDV3188704.1 hypothetical protein [Candidatus Phytoplasma australasiaticum]MDV3192330.1 hypothetical protein [Candidatus Phytoplasma australasiaticum]MDV3194592.1 hypothetical protein [Candidatus Phytoplasma australasiaticum]
LVIENGDQIIEAREKTIAKLNQDKTDLETAKTNLETAKNRVIMEQSQTIEAREKTIEDRDRTIKKGDQIIEAQKQNIEDRVLVIENGDQIIEAREKTIEDRDRTIVILTKTEEINFEQKKYLYNKINKISEQQLTFSKKIINLIKQYLKNLYLINNQIWKLLFQQYSRMYFIIILCVINILFYFLLIKNFKSY